MDSFIDVLSNNPQKDSCVDFSDNESKNSRKMSVTDEDYIECFNSDEILSSSINEIHSTQNKSFLTPLKEEVINAKEESLDENDDLSMSLSEIHISTKDVKKKEDLNISFNKETCNFNLNLDFLST